MCGKLKTKSGPSRDQVDVLGLCLTECSMKELLEHFGRSNRTKLREQVLLPLLASGLIAMTIPEKPTSSKQRYRITESGRKSLEAAALKPE